MTYRQREDRYQMIAAVARRAFRDGYAPKTVDYCSPLAGPGSYFRAEVDAVAIRAARARCGVCGDTVARCGCLVSR
jgi:hypothetical protein